MYLHILLPDHQVVQQVQGLPDFLDYPRVEFIT